MSKKTRGKTNGSTAQKTRYKGVAQKNREARLGRHVKKFPNDEQSKAALAKGVSPRGGKRRSGKGVLAEFTVTNENGVAVIGADKKIITEKRHVGKRVGTADKLYLQMTAKARRTHNALATLPFEKDEKGNKTKFRMSPVNYAASL